jgi:hypothetical protein
MIRTVSALTLIALAHAASAGECETNFRKSGNPFTGADFSSHITVPGLSIKDALGQMRGILIAEKMDVITEDLAGGTMLVEQRSKGTTRAIPSLINVSESANGAKILFTVKTEKGMLATQDAMRGYLCELLAKVQSGEAGRAAAATGAQMQNVDDVTVRDVYMFSREIAKEAKGNPIAVKARHKGRKYALKGRVDYIQEDGEEYNVSFDIPEQHEMVLQLPGNDEPRVGVACLFNEDQLANVLTFRKGESANFTGSFHRYDDFKRMVWLKDCTQTQP